MPDWCSKLKHQVIGTTLQRTDAKRQTNPSKRATPIQNALKQQLHHGWAKWVQALVIAEAAQLWED